MLATEVSLTIVQYDLVVAVVLHNEDTEVGLQYRTDFMSCAYANSMNLVFQNAIQFMCSISQPRPEDSIFQSQLDDSLYNTYYLHNHGTSESFAVESWQSQFEDLDPKCNFPILPTEIVELNIDSSISHVIENPGWRGDHTSATQVLAAWAVLQASYTHSTDVCIGEYPSSESRHEIHSALPKPMRIKIDSGHAVEQLLTIVQSTVKLYEDLPELHPENIRRLGANPSLACDFQTVLFIEDIEETPESLSPAKGMNSHIRLNAPRALSMRVTNSRSRSTITADFDARVISDTQVVGFLWQLETVIRQVCSTLKATSSLAQIKSTSGFDLGRISVWNGQDHGAVEACVHDIFSQRVQQMPDSQAISAWDGSLTYKQLDQLSNRLAHRLIRHGVKPGVIVPIYFEKSMWVPVAVLAIMKAGGASVTIDQALAAGRISSIIDQVDAELVILSPQAVPKATQCKIRQLLVLSQAAIDGFPDSSDSCSLPTDIKPSDLLYVVFTSGSTGQPKGAMVTHANFASAIHYQQKPLGYGSDHIVYDFAPYAFDVSWSNLLHSLTSGSCLYIPSEYEKRNDLSKSLQDSKATLLNSTPSMLRTLDPKDFPDLKKVLASGEPFTEADLGDWMDQKELINTYGPAECSVKASMTPVVRGMVPNNIGQGYGLKTWIVKTDGSEELAPVGSTGELWLEGPQVGRGYLKDDVKTANSFVTRSGWLYPNGVPKRFYRTGDIVRYDPSGALIFMGRIDSQVKIRGQRTELMDIEHHIKACLVACGDSVQIIADILKPQASDNPVLVAFVQVKNLDRPAKLAGLDEALATQIPEYMIPTIWVGLESFPLTATGKTDRKTLHLMHSTMTLEQLIALDTIRGIPATVPSTSLEKILQRLWADVLKIDASMICSTDNFLRIGGDSLGAMRLVSLARAQGFTLSVADIFRNPKLDSLARVIEVQKPSSNCVASPVDPFSLLDSSLPVGEIKAQAASLCNLGVSDIEDVFPCTPFQEGLMAETLRRPGDGILTETRSLKNDIDVARFQQAWKETVAATPILRTRIISINQGLVQVILRSECCLDTDHIPVQSFGLGTPLVQWTMPSASRSTPPCFTWNVHHSLYDGWSMPLMFESLCACYLSQPVPDAASLQGFVKYIGECDRSGVEAYWWDQFSDFDAQRFPTLPSKTYKPRCDQSLNVDIGGITWDRDHTAATMIRLAWAILLSAITNATDVSFGTTLSGRTTPCTNAERMIGPTLATVPIRIQLNPQHLVRDVLEQVQLQAAEMSPYEQFGMQAIQKLSEDCKVGCQFQSHMVIQPASEEAIDSILFEPLVNKDVIKADDVETLKTFAISMDLTLRQDGVLLRASYDSNVVPETYFSRLMERFESILRQLCYPEAQTRPLCSIDTRSRTDIKQIWTWNEATMEESMETVHGIFARTAARQPDAQAICAHDGDFTYSRLNDLSTLLAQQLVLSGLTQPADRIVPLFFEKSKWTAVCQIAVMKANGTSCNLDAKLPDERLRTILELTKPRIILTSQIQLARARELSTQGVQIITVDDSIVASLDQSLCTPLPTVDPHAWLYVVFTSGSTGTPKGAIIDHANFANALKCQQNALHFDRHTRAYDFVSYAFDVSWLNVLFTLTSGGCLCVPTEHEIQNAPHEPVARMQINTAFITPTVGKLLRGSDIKIINYGGEVLPQEEIMYWQDKATILHSYGPSECTPIAITHVLDASRQRVVIGRGLGAHSWVVESDMGDRLVAIGDIGELWLEGPIVGQGYLNDKERTDAAFVKDPDWLTQGSPGFKGRHGRLYRTGDLVRYAEDGMLEFIGRKDAQVKIRGQRVELEEIEHHVHVAVGVDNVRQVVVDMVTPADSTDKILLAFVEPTDGNIIAGTIQAETFLRQLLATTKSLLAVSMASYMIPNGFMLVNSIPHTMTQKVDRNRLRKLASSLRKKELLQVGTDRRQKHEAQTPRESRLHCLTARVLSLDDAAFDVDDNFIQLGGDSISAMRFAEAARCEGFSITVADILTTERLTDLLEASTTHLNAIQHEEGSHNISEVKDLARSIYPKVMPQIQPGHGKLTELLPTTHMQDSYLEDNLSMPRVSWLHSYIDFDQTVDALRLMQSCERLIEYTDMYRTAFAHSSGRYYQIIFDSWKGCVRFADDVNCLENTLKSLVKKDLTSPLVLGAPLAHFHILRTPGKSVRLVFSMSHAVYDALSIAQTLVTLSNIYLDHPQPLSDFASYVKFVEKRKALSYDYWRETLHGSSMTVLPTISFDTGRPTVVDYTVSLPSPLAGITQATFFTFACATALGHLSGSSDVVFGRVVSGRGGVPDHLQKVIGPCLNRAPVRVKLAARGAESRLEQLVALQKQCTASISHETVGLRDIVQNCTDWPCDTDRLACFCQYQNVDERPNIGIPGAIGGLDHGKTWDVPLAPSSLEIFAMPRGKKHLKVTVIAGSGFGDGLPRELLRRVCDELSQDVSKENTHLDLE